MLFNKFVKHTLFSSILPNEIISIAILYFFNFFPKVINSSGLDLIGEPTNKIILCF